MPFEIRIDEARRLVVAEYAGAIDAATTLAYVARAREKSVETGLNILYDMRGATPGDMSSGALYWMPRQVPQLQGVAARRVRAALLHPPQFAPIAAYWENTFRNAGLTVRAFTNEEEAEDWLAASRPSPPAES